MDFPEPEHDQPSSEVSDLQTAKVALHGALAMVRNLQDLTNRLKGEGQDAAAREKMALQQAKEAQTRILQMQTEIQQLKLSQQLFAAEQGPQVLKNRIQELEATISDLQSMAKTKSEELSETRSEMLKKERRVAELLKENVTVKLRMHEEWAEAIKNLEAERAKAIEHATQAREQALQETAVEWSQRVLKLENECKALLRMLEEREDLLGLPFNERNQEIANQRAQHERELWSERNQAREAAKIEISEQFKQKLAIAQEEHEQVVAALKQQLADEIEAAHQKIVVLQQRYTQREEERRLHYEQKEAEFRERMNGAQQAQDDEFTEKEKTLRAEMQTLLAAERQKLEADKQRQWEDFDHLKDALEKDFARKEELLKERYQIQEQAAQDVEVLKAAFEKELARQEQTIKERYRLEEQAAEEKAKEKEQSLRKQWIEQKNAQERLHDEVLEHERQALGVKQKEIQAAKQQLVQREEEHRAALKDLQAEIDRREAQHKESAKRDADHQREMTALQADKERLDQQFKQFRQEATQKTEALQQRSREIEDHLLKAKEKAEAVTLREGRLHVAEEQCVALRDQLTAALRRVGTVDPKAGGRNQTAIDDWIFGFAHQIRNPLAIIRSTAEALTNAKTADRGALDAIIQSADGLAGRLAQFMEFSKPMEPSFQTVRISDVMTRALTAMQEPFARFAIQIHYASEEQVPSVQGNADQFERAFVYLLKNAQEAMSKGGKLDIAVRYDKASDQVTVSIQDSGSGLKADHLPDIGKPFFSTKAGHAGLGLAQVKRILHLYAGDIKLENGPAGGALVRCIFPRKGWGS